MEVETIEETIDQDCLPSFYETEEEYGPVCSSCAETMMGMGEDGEMELKAEHRGKVSIWMGITGIGQTERPGDRDLHDGGEEGAKSLKF